MMSKLESAQKRVETREDFIAFVQLLREELASDRGKWENATLETYLEAMQAVLTDWRGRFINRSEAVPETPTWGLIAEVLLAATAYE
jgi:TorA maturation chaperone TorD